MKNQEVMQLDLFEGILLTQEQQEMIDRHIKNCDDHAVKRQNEINRIENLLIEAGFQLGVDYKNTFKIEEVTEDVTLGSSWSNNQFEAKDVTFKKHNGDVFLMSREYDERQNIVQDVSVTIWKEGDKFECSRLVGSYRKVKPATLLEKLKEHRERAQYTYERKNKERLAIEKVIGEIEAKCPSAKVGTSIEYTRNWNQYKVVQATFKNGSYITWRVYVDGTYHIDKKYDAALKAMKTDEVLDFFANQNK